MKISAIILPILLVLAAEAQVDAYLDPGSGSMLVQLLLGGVAGAAVIMKLGWQRFKDMFRSPRAARGEGQQASAEERGGGPPRRSNDE